MGLDGPGTSRIIYLTENPFIKSQVKQSALYVLTQQWEQMCTVTRFSPKVGQIGPKWDKSRKFSDQIQYILARCDAPKCTESDLKISRICPIWGQSDPLWG